MTEVAQDVDGELRSVEIFLDDRIGDVVDKKREVLGCMNREGADTASSSARLDEQRKLGAQRQIGRQIRLGGTHAVRTQMLTRQQLVVADPAGGFGRDRDPDAPPFEASGSGA